MVSNSEIKESIKPLIVLYFLLESRFLQALKMFMVEVVCLWFQSAESASKNVGVARWSVLDHRCTNEDTFWKHVKLNP